MACTTVVKGEVVEDCAGMMGTRQQERRRSTNMVGRSTNIELLAALKVGVIGVGAASCKLRIEAGQSFACLRAPGWSARALPFVFSPACQYVASNTYVEGAERQIRWPNYE